MPQTPILENSSVEQNVSYANFRATKREVLAAMHLAGLDDLDPQKLCGEGGNKLSGGQKQRVAIARALIRNQSSILFYDEATSGLDPALEREIQIKLDEISIGRTTLIITDRLHTVVNADQIIYLENGRIAEQGNYQELMARPAGRFKQQMRAQCASLGINLDQIRPQPRVKQPAFVPANTDQRALLLHKEPFIEAPIS
ncbi:ATP-binding cassette domain-containing protein [Rickettsiella massiliensis]|uniref:ATP-binding cassette domain-containing protein n=1 Tax=Rickettsiella massiliensis TaxID=676517 RepID=UPI002E1B6709|nr:ATP-binding cassette domain-containing protein [Rickettsiella massiliensis]